MQWEMDPLAGFDYFEFPNGLSVHSKTYPGCPFEVTSFIVYGGSFQDRAGKEGEAHFVEHLPALNVPGMDVEHLQSLFKSWGGEGHFGGTSLHASSYGFFCPIDPARIQEAFRIFGVMLFESALAEDTVEHERRIIIQEMSNAIPFHREMQGLQNQSLYPGHRLADLVGNIAGTVETVGALSREDLVTIYERYYVPANVVVVTVGGLGVPQLQNILAKTAFAKDRPGSRTPSAPTYVGPEIVTPNRYTFSMLEKAGLKVEFGSYESKAVLPDRFFPEHVAVVTSALRSLMFGTIRQKHVATYHFGADFHVLPGHSVLDIDGRATPSLFASSVELVERCIEWAATKDLFLKHRNERIQDNRLCDKSIQSIVRDASGLLIRAQQLRTYTDSIQRLEEMTFDVYLDILSQLKPERRYTILAYP